MGKERKKNASLNERIDYHSDVILNARVENIFPTKPLKQDIKPDLKPKPKPKPKND